MTEWMHVIFFNKPKAGKIYDNCWKEISILKEKQENEDSGSHDKEQSFSLPPSAILETLNMFLQGLEEYPKQSTSLQSKQYSTRKLKKNHLLKKNCLLMHLIHQKMTLNL